MKFHDAVLPSSFRDQFAFRIVINRIGDSFHGTVHTEGTVP